MSHGHHGHAHTHAISADANKGRLLIALALICSLMVGEALAGVIANSLALLSDAAHMLADAAALGFSLLAIRLTQSPVRARFTFGFGRAEILSAMLNGLTLFGLSVLIVAEAIGRLVSPPSVHAQLVLFVAIAGVLVNLAASWTLARADRRSLNVEGSFQHVLTDLMAFIGTMIAATVILLTGFKAADPIASLVVAALMLRSAYGLLGETTRVLLEGAPVGLDTNEIGRAMASHPGVVEAHDLHLWEITSGFQALTAHILVASSVDCHAVREELHQLLSQRFQIEHTTLQVEHEHEQLIQLKASATTAPVRPGCASAHRQE
jgi:cobalt-zinc-cadmium efflux system protein